MSDVVGGSRQRDGELNGALGFVVYGLYLLSLAFPFAPTIVGVVIAYARQGDADPVTRSHHAFQIRTFWMTLLLGVLSLALLAGSASAAFVGVMDGVIGRDGWDAWDWVAFDEGDFRPTPLALLLALGSGLTALASVIWLVVASVFGLVRLASGRPIGDSRRA